jgi:outer membrane protein OmpA-like peptidoglycan-associated protein
MGLSERRAKPVVRYLSQKGVSSGQVTTVYYGEEKPAESNDTKEGRSKNRRVEFKILKL